MATKKQAKQLAKKLNLQFREMTDKLNRFGGDETGYDVIRYNHETKKVFLRQTCYNCGDGHSTDVTIIAETL